MARSKHWCVAVVLSASVLGAGASGFSQAAPQQNPRMTAPTPDARALFERGVAELGESRFADAAASFEASYRLNPVPVALFNLAFAYRGLGRNLEAIAMFDRYLGDATTATAPQAPQAREERERLRAALVRVTVTTDPQGCTVLVDGRAPTREGAEILLDPGAHAIEVTRDGYRPFHRDLNVTAGQREAVSATLVEVDTAARLRVEPSVPTAQVTIDGTLVGTGTVERPSTPGMHTVIVSAEGYETVRRQVRVSAAGLMRFDVVLVRPARSAWPWLGPTIGVAAAAAITGVIVGILIATRGEESPFCQRGLSWDCPPLPMGGTGAR